MLKAKPETWFLKYSAYYTEAIFEVNYRMAFAIYENKKNRNSEFSQGESKGNNVLI